MQIEPIFHRKCETDSTEICWHNAETIYYEFSIMNYNRLIEHKFSRLNPLKKTINGYIKENESEFIIMLHGTKTTINKQEYKRSIDFGYIGLFPLNDENHKDLKYYEVEFKELKLIEKEN